ncbi:MAG TPA: hypothetical protein P5141_04360 [Candidatus Hydrogenedentes bacterium]|nr:hypothetical protein [Candidatus Hydrogenedentota bacterium]HOC71442.1 hypothetical protein [Candidatus Hydrogenedentota bacterium]HOH51764.1 hypothetical protein [Candidatus Hydrogenedentota bacterium]HPA40677.1 hypothetical protein [Candidatus Hydrogenedentota bacterium]HQL93902.1 hypothetical protein [Candidatus Hydrogenedentota bacterium]
MDSNKFLIVVAAVLAAFLGLPIVMQQLKANQQGAAATAPAAGAASAPGAAPAAAAATPREPPRLNASNIVGTEWAIQADQYKLKVTVMPSGVLYVYHPMLKSMMGVDYIQGSWQLDYDKFIVSGQFGGQTMNETVYISGDKLISKGGTPVERFK